MEGDKVALCTVVDDEYAIGLAALLRSFRKSNPNVVLPMIVYHGDSLAARSRLMIESEYPLVVYKKIDAERYAGCKFSSYRRWGINPAWRYEIFRNRDFDQLIYVDADMLIVGDIRPLLEFRGALAACRLPPGEGMELRKTGGFNAGLMSLGREIRTPDVWAELLKVAESRPWSGNQTVLNVVLGGRVAPLPNIFNMTTCEVTPSNLAAAKILHYVGWQKPWEKEPFDPYQIDKAGADVCKTLLDIWRANAPAGTGF